MKDDKTGHIINLSPKLVSTLEYLSSIPSLIVGEIVSTNRKKYHNYDEDDVEFGDLMMLYKTNNDIAKHFAIYVINADLFPIDSNKQYLTKDEFKRKMNICNSYLIKAPDLRKRFTDYVYEYRRTALAPTKS